MFRPSRPMIRPFISSLGSSTRDTVVSAAWLAATRWSASATRLRARRFASVRASSSACLTVRASSCRTRSSEASRRCCFASFTVSPEMRWSSFSALSFACLSSSCSCFRCVSRSASPCSRRLSSTSLRSTSASLLSTRSSIFTIWARRSCTSRPTSLRSRTASSRASISASRRWFSASRSASARSCARVRSAAPSFEPAMLRRITSASSAPATRAKIPTSVAMRMTMGGPPGWSARLSSGRHRLSAVAAHPESGRETEPGSSVGGPDPRAPTVALQALPER